MLMVERIAKPSERGLKKGKLAPVASTVSLVPVFDIPTLRNIQETLVEFPKLRMRWYETVRPDRYQVH